MPADFVVFAESLGWLLALMLAALVSGLPSMRSRTHFGWVIAFCATRFIVAAHGLVFSAWLSETRELAAIVSGILLWEFARRVWNDRHPRRISAATHVIALECFALIFAANAAAGWTAILGWLLPVTLLVAALPVLLGAGAALLLWCSFESRALRFALAGLGLYGLNAAAWPVQIAGSAAPWLVAGGLSGLCFTVPAIRTRVIFTWLAGLILIFAAGPFVIAANLRSIDQEQHAELLSRGQQAAAVIPARTIAQLDSGGPSGVEASDAIREQLKNLSRSDGLLREASLWKIRGDRKLTLDFGGGVGTWIEQREATAVEALKSFGLRSFIVRAEKRVMVHGPLKSASLETPVAWLELDYPEAFWTMQRDQARHNGVVFMAVLAGFCAVGFVLAGRQAIEGAQRVEIERVQAADKAKTEFLAFLGHELRTPLQAILGRAELLRTQPEAMRHADAIETQGRLLLRLVTDLLDLGTIEAGRFELRPKTFSLRGLLSAIEEETRLQAHAADLSYTCTVDAALPDLLIGDDTRLRQILANLLGNAVKYTKSGGISLHVGSEGAELSGVSLVIRVRDTGPGLPPDKIPQLFTLFTRLDSGETFTREGTGVGLALVQRLCSLMGGTVEAANHPAGGAEFTVRLTFPLGETMPEAALTDPAVSVSSPGLVILLAEDHTATRELLGEALTAAGHKVVCVADGVAALAEAAGRAFDVVVLDINLPRLDGIALARELRARYPALRIIGCSAEASPPIRKGALAAGMNELLVKPVGLETLIRTLGPESRANSDSVFVRLRSGDSAARVRALLRAEWPRLSIAAAKEHSAGDRDAFKKCAHYLRSSALLLGDKSLLDLCGRLAAEDQRAGNDHPRLILEAFEEHFAKWPAEPNPPSPSDAPKHEFVT